MKLLTDEKELAELVKLCAAATPRPWIAQWHYWDGAEGLSDWYRPLEQEGYEKHCTMQVTGIDIDTFHDHRTYAKISRNDLLFVSRARTDLPRAVATIRVLKAALERIVSLHLDRHDYPEYDVTLSTEVPRKEWGQGVADGRREAAEIAQAALRGEEAPDEATDG